MINCTEYISKFPITENKDSNDLEKIYNKVDYYHLDYDLSKNIINNLRHKIKENIYRAIATFSCNIHHFEDFSCQKIALINYPPERYTKQNLRSEILKLKDVDEIEFPWNKVYLKWGRKDWDKILAHCNEYGIKLRPMLEMGIQDEQYITDTVNYLKNIGIYSIMTSTGLIPEITTIEKWNSIKNKIPRIFETKVGGIISHNDISEFLNSDISLAATTILFSNNNIYKKHN